PLRTYDGRRSPLAGSFPTRMTSISGLAPLPSHSTPLREPKRTVQPEETRLRLNRHLEEWRSGFSAPEPLCKATQSESYFQDFQRAGNSPNRPSNNSVLAEAIPTGTTPEAQPKPAPESSTSAVLFSTEALCEEPAIA